MYVDFSLTYNRKKLDAILQGDDTAVEPFSVKREKPRDIMEWKLSR